jgi:hypothetical protein
MTPQLNKSITSWRSICKTSKNSLIQSEMLDSSKELESTPAGTFQFSHKSSIQVCLNQQDNWEKMSNPLSISSCNKEDSTLPTPIKLWLPKVSLEPEISNLDHMRPSLESHQSLKDNITCKSFQVVLMPKNLLSK